MRRPSATVLARQSAKMDARLAATAERIAMLRAVTPGADDADVRYLAIHHAPALPALLRVLASLTPSEN
jgi:hypothetical protein